MRMKTYLKRQMLPPMGPCATSLHGINEISTFCGVGGDEGSSRVPIRYYAKNNRRMEPRILRSEASYVC